MTVLQVGQQNGDFNAWFARLPNVLVRYVPYDTTSFKNIRTSICITNLERNPQATLNAALQEELQARLTQEYNQYHLGQEPKFLALTDLQSGPDYRNLDIPVFYHRIGTQDIVNSRGAQVLFPADIPIDGPHGTINAQVQVGRATFFPNQPTQANVNQGQVQILAGGGFGPRVTAIRTTIETELNGPAANDLIRPIRK